MRRLVPCAAILAGLALGARADDNSDISDARAFAAPVIQSLCQPIQAATKSPASRVFHLSFREPGQDQDSPDLTRTLVQLRCDSEIGQEASLWIMRDDQHGSWKLVSFAEPRADYDYTDESFTRLIAPPVVSGYVTVTRLINSALDEASLSIISRFDWRGGKDAWSSGRWTFQQGDFVLKRYEIDPAFGVTGDTPAKGEPRSYVLFDGGGEKP